MLSDYFDEYSLNARVRPALLSLLPVILSVYVSFPKLYEVGAGLFGLLLVCGLITALAHFARYQGRRIEKTLYAKWGAKPTTQFLRKNDENIDRVTKERYYSFFQKNIENWDLPKTNSNNESTEEADYFYESAVKWLLEKTRDIKKYRLIYKENIGYGFRRNCYGIKWYAVFMGASSIGFLIFNILFPDVINSQSNIVLSGAVILLSTMLLGWWLFLVTSKWVKDSAESYAIRLLASSEIINS